MAGREGGTPGTGNQSSFPEQCGPRGRETAVRAALGSVRVCVPSWWPDAEGKPPRTGKAAGSGVAPTPAQ